MKTTLNIMNRVTKKLIIKTLIVYLYNNDNPMNPTSKPSLQPGLGMRWVQEGALQGWRARKGPLVCFHSEWARKGPKGWRARKGPLVWFQNGPERAQRVEGPFCLGFENGPERAQKVEGPERALSFLNGPERAHSEWVWKGAKQGKRAHRMRAREGLLFKGPVP